MNFFKQFLLKIGKLKIALPPALAGGKQIMALAK
jgi:hypothetical protein